jgi:copper chaperone CopZ
LERLDGVVKVTSGFLNSKEINRVTYDKHKIDPQTMIQALKKAGTYIGIAEQP